jgi:hypothetical protein
MNDTVRAARSAVEALRSGVPNRDAVARLGTTQKGLRDAFDTALEAVGNGLGAGPIVFSAGFGRGKSHLLECLAAEAERNGFVTSYVTVSAEAPLGNAVAVLKAMAESARAPGHEGKALHELAARFRASSAAFDDVRRWAAETPIEGRFQALLHLYQELHADEELCMRILDDLEGNALPVGEMRRALKGIGQAGAYDVHNPRAALLAPSRILLFARLCRAMTGHGLVVLFDELERLRNFTFGQRCRAYAQIGWWSEAARAQGAALLPVFAVTDTFVEETITGGRPPDELRIENSPPSDDAFQLLGIREGLKTIKAGLSRKLKELTEDEEEEIQTRVRCLYEDAYGEAVQPCPPPTGGRASSISVRNEIRRWITTWDLHRYDSSYDASIEEEELGEDTSEISDQELPSENGAGEGE